MPRRQVDIEPTLLSEVERIGKKERVSVSQIVNEALAIALAERTRRLQMPQLPRPISIVSRRPERDDALSVLDF
jgi:metal-responsive CopG/Arc/MetJ family transcriptional regulator